jgi:Serine dehydrogenase proteinase
MMNGADLDQSILALINGSAIKLENLLSADVVSYHGSIHPSFFRYFRNFVETVKEKSDRSDGAIAVVLRTGGGSAETVERMVDVLRHHYRSVYFVVPDYAMSAGTILCMSGDKIYMDYASALGPIDPQIMSSDGTGYIPAMGYLDKVEELTAKPALNPGDAVLLSGIDLAKLALFEQAKNLSVDLLKRWLVKFKFKDWNAHRTNNPGSPVTDTEKTDRATEIADHLSNHKLWRSHGRNLNIERLVELRLEIDDYSDQNDLRDAIRQYNDLLTAHVDRNQLPVYLHSHHIEGI